jgi:predicted nucleotidyltransferase
MMTRIIERKRLLLAQKALCEAHKLAADLKERFEFDSIYLIGSLQTGRFGFHSDIDLVVKGMKNEDFFKAYAFLIKESDFDIDLKPFEDLYDSLKTRTLKEGIIIG